MDISDPAPKVTKGDTALNQRSLLNALDLKWGMWKKSKHVIRILGEGRAPRAPSKEGQVFVLVKLFLTWKCYLLNVVWN